MDHSNYDNLRANSPPVKRFLQNLTINFGSCPHTGDGVNPWVNSVVVSALNYGISSEDIRRIVKRLAAKCGRSVDPDITQSLKTAAANLGLGDGSGPENSHSSDASRKYNWPKPSPDKQAEVLKWAGAWGRADLEASSPVDVSVLTAESVLSVLYPQDGLVCCGMEDWNAVIATTDIWIRSGVLSEYQLIVPSLMKGTLVYYKGQLLLDRAGRPSIRLLINTLQRLYLVHEWDHTSHNDQARYIKYLCQWGSLVMVVDSGGESLHAWWDAIGVAEELLKRFHTLACLLGADSTKYPTNSYFRLPGGLRSENGQRQRIVYFDPSKVGNR